MVPIRIGIVEDHEVVVVGIRAMLAATPDLNVLAIASSVPDLLADAVDLDVVILDLRLPDGSDPTGNVVALLATGVKVLAYTSGEDPSLVRAAARAGVHGMVRKSEPGVQLMTAIRGVAAGAVAASSDWAAAIDADPESSVRLTERETEVLRLYASGEKADRVARLLGIGRETVLDHIRRVRLKYAADDRPAHTKVDLYRRAIEDGVIATPPHPLNWG